MATLPGAVAKARKVPAAPPAGTSPDGGGAHQKGCRCRRRAPMFMRLPAAREASITRARRQPARGCRRCRRSSRPPAPCVAPVQLQAVAGVVQQADALAALQGGAPWRRLDHLGAQGVAQLHHLEAELAQRCRPWRPRRSRHCATRHVAGIRGVADHQRQAGRRAPARRRAGVSKARQERRRPGATGGPTRSWLARRSRPDRSPRASPRHQRGRISRKVRQASGPHRAAAPNRCVPSGLHGHWHRSSSRSGRPELPATAR